MNRSEAAAKPTRPSAGPHVETWIERALRYVALATVFVVPLAISATGSDSFRLPKTVVLHAGGIVLAAIAIIGAVLGRIPPEALLPPRRVAWLMAAVVGCTAISTIVSTNLRRSAWSDLTVISVITLTSILIASAPRVSTSVLFVIFVPGIINAILIALQELKIWNPLADSERRMLHESSTAFIGNPNDVGMFMTPLLVAAVTLTLASSRRLLPAVVSSLLFTAIVLSQTRTAIGAVLAGCIVLAIQTWKRRAVVAVALIFTISIIGTMLYTPIAVRILAPERFDLTHYTSGRPVAFAAAARMIVERPFFGVGPGCFESAFFEKKVEVQNHWPRLVPPGEQIMFGEVHNDYLQVAAETGLAGFVLFLTGIVVIGSSRFRRAAADEAPPKLEQRFARMLGLPLAGSFAILAVAQFPLQLAAPTVAYCFLAALVIGWNDAQTH